MPLSHIWLDLSVGQLNTYDDGRFTERVFTSHRVAIGGGVNGVSDINAFRKELHRLLDEAIAHETIRVKHLQENDVKFTLVTP